MKAAAKLPLALLGTVWAWVLHHLTADVLLLAIVHPKGGSGLLKLLVTGFAAVFIAATMAVVVAAAFGTLRLLYVLITGGPAGVIPTGSRSLFRFVVGERRS